MRTFNDPFLDFSQGKENKKEKSNSVTGTHFVPTYFQSFAFWWFKNGSILFCVERFISEVLERWKKIFWADTPSANWKLRRHQAFALSTFSFQTLQRAVWASQRGRRNFDIWSCPEDLVAVLLSAWWWHSLLGKHKDLHEITCSKIPDFLFDAVGSKLSPVSLTTVPLELFPILPRILTVFLSSVR